MMTRKKVRCFPRPPRLNFFKAHTRTHTHTHTQTHAHTHTYTLTANASEKVAKKYVLEDWLNFDVANAHCYDPNEETKILSVISASGKTEFNQKIRGEV